MNAVVIRTAGRYLGAWGAIVLCVILLSLLFTFLGTITCAVLAGMMMGRLIGSRLVRRGGEHRLVLGSIFTAVCGFLMFWLAGPAALVLAGLLLTGLGVACLYPMLQSLALRATPGQSVQASARTTLASGVAILASPLLLGSLADAMGIARAYGVVAVLLMGVFAMLQLANRRPQPDC